MAEIETSDHQPSAKGGTVHVPGMGPVKKKTALYGALAAVGLVLGYIYLKQKGTIGGGSATGAQVTDPAGNVCSALDPSSGYCPGTAQDQAFYAQSGGFGGSGLFDSSGNPITDPGGNGQPGTPGPGSFTNNAEWSQYCESLMGSNGADAIAAALGKFITGGVVTTDQVTIIDEAIAVGGEPPIQGAGGRPPSINVGSPGPGPGGKVNVKVTAKYDNITGTWGKVTGATSYEVKVTDHMGSKVLGTGSTTGTSATVGHLPQKQSMAFHVTAEPGGQTGVAYTTTK